MAAVLGMVSGIGGGILRADLYAVFLRMMAIDRGWHVPAARSRADDDP